MGYGSCSFSVGLSVQGVGEPPKTLEQIRQSIIDRFPISAHERFTTAVCKQCGIEDVAISKKSGICPVCRCRHFFPEEEVGQMSREEFRQTFMTWPTESQS
jgi:hypothetical protein